MKKLWLGTQKMKESLNKKLRISVNAGGCSGFQYQIAISSLSHAYVQAAV